MVTLDQFINQWNGKYLEYNNDQYKYQCTDLFWQYLKDVLGIDPRPYQGWGSAINVWNNYLRITGAYNSFTRVQNGLYNAPSKGDIIFWGWYPFVTGTAGHVAICTGANPMQFISFDQNWGKPNFCRYVNHNYKGVKGWWVKK